jgi:hypothetical protein
MKKARAEKNVAASRQRQLAGEGIVRLRIRRDAGRSPESRA